MVKTIVKIDGMMCNMCETHVNDAIRNAFPVKKVSASHTKGEAEILSDGELDREKLESVIGETGYKVLDVSAQAVEKKGLLGGLFGK